MTSPARATPAALLVLCLLALPAAQEAPAPRPGFKAGIDVVTVTATVVDANGRLVTGLGKDDFQVFDDSVPQTITQFSNERVPVSLGLLLDVSDSMTGQRMDDARLALDQFLGEWLDPGDEAFVGVFNHRPRTIAPWTLRPGQLRGVLDGVIPTGGTAIYDAIAQALTKFPHRAHQRAAIVVVSDGADTASDTDLRTLRTQLRRNEAFVYAVAIDSPEGRRRINTAVDPAALRAITDDSGGFTEVVRDTKELGPATQRIATELNSQYLIGYVSPHPTDGNYHSIRVRTTNPEYRVRSRKGYIGELKR
jgi:Ca-activated chloride channel family protein